MPKSFLILLTGLPATGKSTLGRQLSERLGIPYISKDDIKEIMFDRLGWSDREWSKKVGTATYDLLYYFLEPFLQNGASLIIDSNFSPKFDAPRFLGLREKYGYGGCQILLRACSRSNGRATSIFSLTLGRKRPSPAHRPRILAITAFFSLKVGSATFRPPEARSGLKLAAAGPGQRS
jgi:hypothetical protein